MYVGISVSAFSFLPKFLIFQPHNLSFIACMFKIVFVIVWFNSRWISLATWLHWFHFGRGQFPVGSPTLASDPR